jgi:plasmid stability protein
VRTTLTLDDDVAAKLKHETRRSGRSFKETVNAVLRRGLTAQTQRRARPPFVVQARPLGLRPGLNYDKTSDLLDQIEGPLHR